MGLSEAPQPATTATHRGDRPVGLGKIEWVPFAPSELPAEQSADDARSLVFDSRPLAEDLEILGEPTLQVRVAADRRVARLAVRLCEVTPANQSWLVTFGLLNFCHRNGHEQPEPCEPGRACDIVVPLNFIAHRFKAGSRIRAAISESLWPLVWPSPESVELTLQLASCRLEIPVRTATEEPEMDIAPAPPLASGAESWPTLEVVEDGPGVRVVETWPEAVDRHADTGLETTSAGPNLDLTMAAGDAASCVWRARQEVSFRRQGWTAEVVSQVAVAASGARFEVSERLTAKLNGETVADIVQPASIVRKLM